MKCTCKNPSCSNTFVCAKYGAHQKKFCSTKCRQQFHSWRNPSSYTTTTTTTPTTTESTIDQKVGQSFLKRAARPVVNAIASSSGFGFGGALATGVIADVAMPEIQKGIKTGKIKPIGTFTGAVGGYKLTEGQKWYIRLFGASAGALIGNEFEIFIRNLIQSNRQAANQNQIEVNPSSYTTTTTTTPTTKGITEKTAQEILNTQYKTFNMRGDYFALVFGYRPADPFHAVAYGKPGSGKSTLSMKYAQYFASKFGKVKFLSSEMKEGNGLKSLLNRTQSNSKNLVIDVDPNRSTIDEHIERLKADGTKLLIIDSANHLKWSADDIERIKNSVKGLSTFIILQSIKQGDFRGQNDYVHNADIVLKIQAFEVFTEKSRFEREPLASVAINM